MKYIVNYSPSLSDEDMQRIREAITPSMRSDETALYNAVYIIETFENNKQIQSECEWVDYLEF
jgi:hypothetical protein